MLNLPSVSDTAVSLSSVVAQVGCTADQITEALKNLADLMKRMNWAATEITAIKDDLADLRYDCEGRDGNLSARIDLCEYHLSELRPATDAKTENPKQKSDLEIFNRIVPSEEFLKLEGNMFLN
jgi:ABC-type transporter Mla subunit MlaD